MAERMYDRTWVEIENLLGRADTEIMIQRQHYEDRRNSKDKMVAVVRLLNMQEQKVLL